MKDNTLGQQTKGGKRATPPIKIKPDNTIRVFKHDGIWHCDIEIYKESNPVVRYGAVRHNFQEIGEYYTKQVAFNTAKGILLKDIVN